MCDPVTLFGTTAITGGGTAIAASSTLGPTLAAAAYAPALVSAAPTAGLLGAGGAFNLAQGTLFSGSGLATALQVGSLGTSLYGMQQQSNLMQANLMRQAEIRAYDAKVNENNALMAEWSAFAEADTFLRRLATVRAKQTTAAAKSGVVINQDSPLTVAADTAAEGQLEYLTILNKGVVQAAASRAGAAGKRSAAEQARINAANVQPATNIAMAGETLKTGYSLLRNT